MRLRIERVYGSAPKKGEFRVSVDRIWPRGITKDKAQINLWAKDVAPSDELRKWFDHDPEKYPEFKKKYLVEIKQSPAIKDLLDKIRNHENVVLLYGAKDEKYNQATVLMEYISRNQT